MTSAEPGPAAASHEVRPTHVLLMPDARTLQPSHARLSAVGAEARLTVRGQDAAAVLALIRRQRVLGLCDRGGGGGGRAKRSRRDERDGDGILTGRVEELGVFFLRVPGW